MKQTLLFLIIVTLFSYLLALSCPPSAKAVCEKRDIRSCHCVGLNAHGNWAIEYACNNGKHPVCKGDNNYVQCDCY